MFETKNINNASSWDSQPGMPHSLHYTKGYRSVGFSWALLLPTGIARLVSEDAIEMFCLFVKNTKKNRPLNNMFPIFFTVFLFPIVDDTIFNEEIHIE